MSKTFKIVSGIILVIILALFGFSILTSDEENSANEDGIEREEFVSQEGVVSNVGEAQRLLRTLNKLEDVDLESNITLFDDPAFTRLMEKVINLPNIPRSRANPFEPIGISSQAPDDTDLSDQDLQNNDSTSATGTGDDSEFEGS